MTPPTQAEIVETHRKMEEQAGLWGQITALQCDNDGKLDSDWTCRLLEGHANPRIGTSMREVTKVQAKYLKIIRPNEMFTSPGYLEVDFVGEATCSLDKDTEDGEYQLTC